MENYALWGRKHRVSFFNITDSRISSANSTSKYPTPYHMPKSIHPYSLKVFHVNKKKAEIPCEKESQP